METHYPVIHAVHFPEVENWTVDYPSHHHQDQGERAPYPDIFSLICQKWGALDVKILATRFNNRLPLFVARAKDPLALALDALIFLILSDPSSVNLAPSTKKD